MNIEALMQQLFNDVNWNAVMKTGIRILVIIIAGLILSKVINSLIERLKKRLIDKSRQEGEPPSESGKRVETLTRLLWQSFSLTIWIMVMLSILKEVGAKIGPILAGAGVAGLAVGFGAQNLVRDIISGFFIILENQIRVGDVAIINGTGGLVEKIRFRTTILRDLGGVVHVFPNGSISTLSNMTNEWSAYIFDIGVAYKEDTDRVIEVMEKVGREMKEDDTFGRLMIEEPDIFGVDKFGDSAVVIKGRIKTKPIRQWEVGRQYLRRIKHAFDAQGIEIPFPHRSIYFGENSKPYDLLMTEKAGKSEGTTTESPDSAESETEA
ncbi:mechanosensitive ion channel family protein [Pontiellaceae bacterium B1224]|nr:mechanosensitive ion channel family protein [Pontiellaceae bacterium B1224]